MDGPYGELREEHFGWKDSMFKGPGQVRLDMCQKF